MWNRTRSAKKPSKSARASHTSDGIPKVSASVRAKAKESRGARASQEEQWRPKEQSAEDALGAMKQASGHVSAIRIFSISQDQRQRDHTPIRGRPPRTPCTL